MKHTEVERKFSLSDAEKLRERLTRLGAERQGASRQVDVYYNHPARDFLEGDVVSEWLRLRVDEPAPGEQTASINFKRWLPLGVIESTHAEEFESLIADREAVALLLAGLGFTEMVTVDKSRERWRLGTVEIAIDEVDGLGAFTEFEYSGQGDVEAATKTLTDAVGTVGDGLLGERDRRGYPYLLLGRER